MLDEPRRRIRERRAEADDLLIGRLLIHVDRRQSQPVGLAETNDRLRCEELRPVACRDVGTHDMDAAGTYQRDVRQQ